MMIYNGRIISAPTKIDGISQYSPHLMAKGFPTKRTAEINSTVLNLITHYELTIIGLN
jgi:hypothetical protein